MRHRVREQGQRCTVGLQSERRRRHNDGGIPERVDARPPDPPIEIPPLINVRRMYISRVDVEECGPTKGCPGCQKVTRGTVLSCFVATQ